MLLRPLHVLITALVVFGFPSKVGVAAPDPSALQLFSIAKSENKNQVEYVVHLDDHCSPAGARPVYAYWRMLEKGPTATAPLLAREQKAYGLLSEDVLEHGNSGGQVRLVLRAIRDRTILVQASRGPDGTCRTTCITTIAGQSAHLFNVYVKLRWPFGVSYLLLRGWSLDGTHVVSERMSGAKL